jgi:hypothetical protein
MISCLVSNKKKVRMVQKKRKTKHNIIVTIFLILLIVSLSSSFPLTSTKSSSYLVWQKPSIQNEPTIISSSSSKSSSPIGMDDEEYNPIQDSSTRRIRILNPISFLFGTGISTANAYSDESTTTIAPSSPRWKTSQIQSKSIISSFETSVSKYFSGAMPASQLAERVL